jgi:hypothetical protein
VPLPLPYVYDTDRHVLPSSAFLKATFDYWGTYEIRIWQENLPYGLLFTLFLFVLAIAQGLLE